jgi:hypothetical protein
MITPEKTVVLIEPEAPDAIDASSRARRASGKLRHVQQGAERADPPSPARENRLRVAQKKRG